PAPAPAAQAAPAKPAPAPAETRQPATVTRLEPPQKATPPPEPQATGAAAPTEEETQGATAGDVLFFCCPCERAARSHMQRRRALDHPPQLLAARQGRLRADGGRLERCRRARQLASLAQGHPLGHHHRER